MITCIPMSLYVIDTAQVCKEGLGSEKICGWQKQSQEDNGDGIEET